MNVCVSFGVVETKISLDTIRHKFIVCYITCIFKSQFLLYNDIRGSSN